jgi:methyl-accepting chemotaxis protein
MGFRNIKITHKLIAMTVIGLTVLLSFGLVSVYMGKSQLKSLKGLYAQNMVPLDNLRRIQLIFREIDYQMVGVISAAESSQNALVHLEKSLKQLKTIWEDTNKRLTRTEFGAIKADFARVMKDFSALAGKLKEAYQSDNIDNVDLVHEEWIDLKEKIFKDIDSLAARQKKIAEELYARKEKVITRVISIVLIAMGISIIAFLAVSAMIVRSISKPINRVVMASREVAEGNLSRRINVISRDEMGFMAETLNNMIAKLNNIFTGISENICLITRQSENLSLFSEEMRKAVKNESSHIEQVASATEEMSQTTLDMAKNALSSSESAKVSFNTAERGMSIVEEVVKDIQSLASEINSASEKLMGLGERSKEIGEILSVIQDIADQTNLLALNAAIEAARAGEQGRGFAVVADEVRKLAEKTASATDDIAEKIKAIQDETELTISVMKQGTDAVNASVEKAANAGSALREIVGSSGEVMDMIQRIATATEEQSSMTEQVSQSMDVVANIVKDNAGKVESLTELSAELLEIANRLQTQIGQFITEDCSHGENENMSDVQKMPLLAPETKDMPAMIT